MSITGYERAQRQWENLDPPGDVERCEDGECGACGPCREDRAAYEAEAHAEQQWEDQRLESRFGA